MGVTLHYSTMIQRIQRFGEASNSGAHAPLALITSALTTRPSALPLIHLFNFQGKYYKGNVNNNITIITLITVFIPNNYKGYIYSINGDIFQIPTFLTFKCERNDNIAFFSQNTSFVNHVFCLRK